MSHHISQAFEIEIDKDTGKFRSRNGFGQPVGMGWEYMQPKAVDKVEPMGLTPLYKFSYDIIEDARNGRMFILVDDWVTILVS